jgi:hypothetical protein
MIQPENGIFIKQIKSLVKRKSGRFERSPIKTEKESDLQTDIYNEQMRFPLQSITLSARNRVR